MALGDGIRRNIATVTKEARDRFRDAILALQQKLYPGAKTDTPPGGVGFWFKQDEIHDLHFWPAFLPWHRELVARLEADLRQIDPALSLHYWDWTPGPDQGAGRPGGFVNLFTPDFMGNAIGAAEPGATSVGCNESLNFDVAGAGADLGRRDHRGGNVGKQSHLESLVEASGTNAHIYILLLLGGKSCHM